VNPIPTVSVNPVSICAGNSGTITATPDIAGGTFLWSSGGETTASITVTPNSTSNYSVVYTLNGCTSVSTSTTVTVNPTPTVAVNSASICQNQTATLTASPSVSGGTFLWNPNGETTNAISVSPMVTTNYTVIYTLNGCSSSATQGIVTVNLSPAVSFTADTLSGCIPLTVQFTSTSNSDLNACVWTLSNGSTLTGCNPTFTFDQAGCYDVTLATTLNGCTGSSSVANYICIESNPIAFFTGNPLQLTDENPTIDLENLSTGASTYFWNFGDGDVATDENPSHTYAQNDLGYTIELTATSALGCQSTYAINITYDQQLIFYVPNAFTPDDDEHNPVFKPVFTSGYDPYSYNLSIYDRWGEIIFESNDVNVGWDGTYIQTTGLVQDGIYVWRISFKVNNNDERKVYTGHVNLLK
jgi:gliding motility-associated-like protein